MHGSTITLGQFPLVATRDLDVDRKYETETLLSLLEKQEKEIEYIYCSKNSITIDGDRL